MQSNRKALVVPATALALAVVVGCSGGSASVKGKRDDLRRIPAVQEISHTVSDRVAKSKQLCTGTGTKRRCSTVPDGFRTVNRRVVDRVGHSTVYCVELDDVNGKRSRDDRWYTVTSAVYFKMADKHEGDKVKFSYFHAGCS